MTERPTYTQEELEAMFGDKAKFRTEEPLKGYRQWVFDGLSEKYRKSLEEGKFSI